MRAQFWRDSSKIQRFTSSESDEGDSFDEDIFHDALETRGIKCIRVWDITKNNIIEWGPLNVTFDVTNGPLRRSGSHHIILKNTSNGETWTEGHGYMVYLHDDKLYHVAGSKNKMNSRQILKKPRDQIHTHRWESSTEASFFTHINNPQLYEKTMEVKIGMGFN